MLGITHLLNLGLAEFSSLPNSLSLGGKIHWRGMAGVVFGFHAFKECDRLPLRPGGRFRRRGQAAGAVEAVEDVIEDACGHGAEL